MLITGQELGDILTKAFNELKKEGEEAYKKIEGMQDDVSRATNLGDAEEMQRLGQELMSLKEMSVARSGALMAIATIYSAVADKENFVIKDTIREEQRKDDDRGS